MTRRMQAIVVGGLLTLVAGSAEAPAGLPAQSRPAALPPVSIVPQPLVMRVHDDAYVWPTRLRIGAATPGARSAAALLRAYLAENGVTATVVGPGSGDVFVKASGGRGEGVGDEGYELFVARGGITLDAKGSRGLFYALQTLEQLSARSGGRLRSRAVDIRDVPAYRWRGIHLDVARHFFSVKVVERYIDAAAHYKLNVFHWHLTDDQAWRLPSSRYPALTAGRDSYSRADVREVVAYAARRYVTVVPEIDLPGHATAVVRAYPRLACAHETLCTNSAGLAFARSVLDDAMADFPSPYIHAGGDEVPAPVLATQPRFTRALERDVEAHGRRFAGWDDILTAELSPRALLTVWTSQQRAATAVRHGNDVVLATGPLHFDSVQGDAAQEPRGTRYMSTLEQVYDVSVVPPGLSAAAAAHVIGAQADVWTERIATPDHLFYMALPRELALAENAWTPRARKSWPSFLARLPAQLAWLDAHGYNFRIPNASFALRAGRKIVFESVPGRVQAVRAWTAAPAVTVALRVPVRDAVIRYTADGSAPTASSRAYVRPFTVAAGPAPIVLRAAAFLRGRAGAVSECAVSRIPVEALAAHRGASRSWSALVSP
jgi:hexosaminidase